MSREVIFTIPFLDSLSEIRNYIKEDSEISAEKFVSNIKSKINNLKKFPHLGKQVNRNLYQYFLNKNYLIYYIIIDSKIFILSIKHVKKYKL